MLKAVCNSYMSSELIQVETAEQAKVHSTYVNFVAPTFDGLITKALLYFAVEKYSVTDTGDGRFLLTRLEDEDGNNIPQDHEEAHRATDKLLYLCSYIFQVEPIRLM